ncbi:hypothetical protein [Corynebacterium otitidis]|uniref:Uncharacterized protein n=1 Tax=Corynebacterium otitidis ATCC 51513 TaxID=883169 RepID=K0YRB1_9CORY|nr:hypothetical protein [Corynebacterium otitidis]EJZ82044.1 hypothetical protein HMPREF9719_01027 [Corynebacterium otitidis ATCC 51513]
MTIRKRRRARRPSDAANIDRLADTPHHGFAGSADADAQRVVALDEDAPAEPERSREEELREERPPHY